MADLIRIGHLGKVSLEIEDSQPHFFYLFFRINPRSFFVRWGGKNFALCPFLLKRMPLSVFFFLLFFFSYNIVLFLITGCFVCCSCAGELALTSFILPLNGDSVLFNMLSPIFLNILKTEVS